MITTISLQWASDYIEQKYIFVEFNKFVKVIPIRWTFTDQASWEAVVDPTDQIFIGAITTNLQGSFVGAFADGFVDFDGHKSYGNDYQIIDSDLSGNIRTNIIIEASYYAVTDNLNPIYPYNTAVGYIFNLII